MTTDEPDQPDGAAGSPDDPSASIQPGVAGELPVPPPQVQLINDDDLSWVDRPEETEERRERRRERREEHKRKVRRKRRVRRTGKVAIGLVIALVALSLVWFRWTFGGLERMPASAGQAGLNTPGTTMLLVGSNPEEPDGLDVPGHGWQHAFGTSDLVMLLHLTRDNRSMFVISIPADSLLPIPGSGTGKLSQAYAEGGAKLYVKTIEEYTGVALDRVATLDMNSLREITDRIDGVAVDVPREACQLPVGPRLLNGLESLQYMALQPCMPRLDLDRVERQQSVLRALMRGAVDSGKVTNPFRVNRLLKATSSRLTLEDGFSYPSMLGTLWSMRKLRTSNTTFLTVPVADQPNAVVAGSNVIRLDPAKDAALWAALKQDRLGDYLATNEDAVVLP